MLLRFCRKMHDGCFHLKHEVFEGNNKVLCLTILSTYVTNCM